MRFLVSGDELQSAFIAALVEVLKIFWRLRTMDYTEYLSDRDGALVKDPPPHHIVYRQQNREGTHCFDFRRCEQLPLALILTAFPAVTAPSSVQQLMVVAIDSEQKDKKAMEDYLNTRCNAFRDKFPKANLLEIRLC